MSSRNIEIKAKLPNKDKAIEIAKSISNEDGKLLIHRDVYFGNSSSDEYTKLRFIKDERVELINYMRPKQAGPKLSKYDKNDVENGVEMEKKLSESLGIRGIIEKNRLLFMLDHRTRCHIDSVKNFGDFIEFEVILDKDEPIELGEKIARRYMQSFNISEDDLITKSYIDMVV
ncbi:hypothetical protein O3M35_004530 [Rhynocoris fuscipes]|uniref:CYTH domain-containing protein n=1 Tax=Rhynocoris fuscipes TaxID=488301 RepID=A0AAW1CG16_9HEMI